MFQIVKARGSAARPVSNRSFDRAKISKHSFDKCVFRLPIDRHLATIVAALEDIVCFHKGWKPLERLNKLVKEVERAIDRRKLNAKMRIGGSIFKCREGLGTD